MRFFDDSKGTNIDAVAKALEAFDVPVVLIMGGRNKGYRFDSLAEVIKDHVKGLIVIGEAAEIFCRIWGIWCRAAAVRI